MAAYAALTSLKHIIHQIQHHHFPPISLDRKQVQSLTQIATFLQEFLERYDSPFSYSEEADPLESRIRDAAYAAADLIESHIVDNIQLQQVNCINFYQDLQESIEEMDLIKKEVMEMIREKARVQNQLQRSFSSLKSSSTENNSMMVGFDDALLEIMDTLTRGGAHRQVIPIVGMGGIGKTTLVRNIYAQPLINEHFDVCVWATISQQYNRKQVLSDVYSQVVKETKELLKKMSEDEIGLALYKYLSYRRFLVVMDDVWSIEAWDKIQSFFPENNNGSRIVVTTRLSKLGSQLDKYYGLDMKFLDEVSSWNLFSKVVFGEKSCPRELEEIGKKIVENCRGLPLSIVVMGGLLEKLEHTQECWESISKNSAAVVNTDNNEYCLKILKMSYNHLPIHLKPCFLYMGMFEEDCAIHVSTLIKLWVCEGFVKPTSGKTLEITAEENLKELVDRNLILVDKLGSSGNIKLCKIHDSLRDVSLREAQKQRFDHFIMRHHSGGIAALKSSARERVGVPRSFRMLKILSSFETYFLDDVFELVNLRYLQVKVDWFSRFPSSLNLIWNLHILIVIHDREMVTAPVEIWKMPQLRHVKFQNRKVHLPEPPPRGNGDTTIIIMDNLQTLEGVKNFKFDEEVILRLPNLKKLRVYLNDDKVEPHGDHFCLNNLGRLSKLESLWCQSWGSEDYLHGFAFPHSLKKLHLDFINNFDWEEMLEKIGSLPSLAKLTLKDGCFRTGKWDTVEGQFRSLRFLLLDSCFGLIQWDMMECSHFPCLEDVGLYYLRELEEIPSAIGEIPTLRSITLVGCSKSAVKSAKLIEEEQQELQGDEISFRVQASYITELGNPSVPIPNPLFPNDVPFVVPWIA